jgi:GntR family transcriptional regulator
MKLKIDHKSSVPLHTQAEELLRGLIAKEEYINGKFLPKEVDLATQLAISRTTLRQALNKLVYEGLLIRKKGVGTKVSEQIIDSKSRNWLSFSQEMKSRGIPIKNFELHISWELPGDTLANFFEIRTDRKVLKLERLRGSEQGPIVYFVSYFHPRIGLTGEEDFKRPLYDILESDYSSIATISKEEITAHAADKFISKKLEISLHDPILQRKRFVFDQGDRPMEYNLGYYRSDRFKYVVESRR